MSEGQGGGTFYTPASLVQYMVEKIYELYLPNRRPAESACGHDVFVRDVLVDRATYLDERSFRLDFTESDFNLDDYILHGDAAEDDRPIVRLAGREGSMTVRSDGFRAAPYLALRDCCALSQLVEYAMRIRSGAVDPRSLPLFQLECCLSDRFEQDWNRVAEAVRRRR